VTFSERAKTHRWFEPDFQSRIVLNETGQPLAVQNHGQILVIGKGSSGKAGLGLYILHRKPIPLDEVRAGKGKKESQSKYYESRTLVISFLYQSTYYKNLASRLKTANEERQASLPSHALVDVISLYPGGLTPEDFLSKVDNHLASAELRGIPYTGVLLDGIHNVFVQYPVLEKTNTFWPQLFGLLRRKGVTVVTTHTEFELNSHSLEVDFQQAERRSAPLLSVLISAADYVFELSAVEKTHTTEYAFSVRTMLGEDPPLHPFVWDRQACQLFGTSEQLTLPFDAPGGTLI
jgi:hypothetical protein